MQAMCKGGGVFSAAPRELLLPWICRRATAVAVVRRAVLLSADPYLPCVEIHIHTYTRQ